VELLRDPEPVQERRGLRLRRVAVLFGDDDLQLSEAHPFVVRQPVALGEELLFFAERAPQVLMAHHHHIDDAVLIEHRVILAKHAEPLRQLHAARHGLELLGEDLHERGLAGTVRPRQTVALAGVEGHGDAVEEHAGAKVHRDVVD
jgi:hypothetical protein